jgi:hypothetical protein
MGFRLLLPPVSTLLRKTLTAGSFLAGTRRLEKKRVF